MGKVICKCCGATYVRCVEKRIIDKPQGQHYLICSHKKKYSKKYFQSGNINVETLDKFIEEQRKVYYKNIGLQISLRIVKLRQELSKANSETVDMVNQLIKVETDNLDGLKSSIESLTNVFVGTTSKTIQNIIKAKVEDLEGQIGAIEGKIVYLENKKADKDKYIRELNNKIASLKRENQEVPSKELSRVE